MDGNFIITKGYNVSMRKTRQPSDCSMSSMRLEEIVSILTRPIKDMKQNFDTDFNSLLEDYLTEAGLRQLDQNADHNEVVPNFAEIALLLQQSANIYSKKVDYLWMQVVDIVQSFGSVRHNEEGVEEEPVQRQGRGVRRKHAQLTDFLPIPLQEASHITMRDHDPKPLPVLPKNFIQFEPRIISENDIHIKDYKGELIGVMNDFRVNWNTDENGTLCDDLDFCTEERQSTQQLFVTGSQVNPCLVSPPDSGHNSDYGTDYSAHNACTPLPPDCDAQEDTVNGPAETVLEDHTAEPSVDVPELCIEVVSKNERKNCKRKNQSAVTSVRSKNSKYNITSPFSGTASKLNNLANVSFSLPSNMIQKIIDRRKNKIKKLKRRLESTDMGDRCLDTQYLLDTFVVKMGSKSTMAWHRREILRGIKILSTEWDQDFLGFDCDQTAPSPSDVSGFRGFTQEEIDVSHAKYSRYSVLVNSMLSKKMPNATTTAACSDYEDDEPSDAYCFIDTNDPVQDANIARNLALGAENVVDYTTDQSDVRKRVEAWHASIKDKLIQAERRQEFDVWSYSSDVLSAFQEKKTSEISFREVIRRKPQEDIPRYFLATLMLANSGNVNVTSRDLTGIGDFRMHLLSMEKRFREDDLPF